MGLDQLIADCKKKRPGAQENLYRQFAPILFAVSLKYSRNRTEAEDNLQDSFITIFDKVGQFGNKGSFEGWLKRIVINTALQQYRKQRVFAIVHEEQLCEVPVEIEDDGLALDFLLKIIQELPDRYRLVFNLHVMDGFGHKEISSMLTISEGTSKSNLFRARTILKEKIEAQQATQKPQSSAL